MTDLLAVPVFDAALAGTSCVLDLGAGELVVLPVGRWHAGPDPFDELLLARCAGPTLDVGCGPGRLAAALIRRGVPTLGVDVSAVAVALTVARGAPALRADVFDLLPGEGRWRHVLLADGNVGIGGDPVALLTRVRDLQAPHGTALVEFGAPGTGVRRRTARLGDSATSFPWATVAVDAAPGIAGRAGFTVRATGHLGDRWFAELVRR